MRAAPLLVSITLPGLAKQAKPAITMPGAAQSIMPTEGQPLTPHGAVLHEMAQVSDNGGMLWVRALEHLNGQTLPITVVVNWATGLAR